MFEKFRCQISKKVDKFLKLQQIRTDTSVYTKYTICLLLAVLNFIGKIVGVFIAILTLLIIYGLDEKIPNVNVKGPTCVEIQPINK